MDHKKIRKLVIQGKYELSKHAEKERQIDMIHMWELDEALGGCEIIENYPDDPRGMSCLVLGFCGPKPVHSVCTIRSDPEELLLITLYDPSKRPHKWIENYRKRR
ncbi:MAG: DUF4258 domain-containing protein [Deltaproteobacteria bacterium]|nr:DUF4258 domain-containing protein [Deltaproteobacteria bacterium]MBW1911376.1 DUF4258 domain-containing protein [Deltaproteobacteria bacterium]MBW2034734.1 DUF4258 domain-containing protein [Deltaproteobacteria bacterium]MBW2359112.1 DUF4258 domain-containing protein [Deltaproteobacteria bacterium]